MIALNNIQRQQAIRIFGHAVHESNLHINKILSSGANIFTRGGVEVTLKMAVKRRRRCMKMCKQALKGLIV